MYKSCLDCKHRAQKGRVNTLCLRCMRAYGVHDQETNKELADMYINFPKADLFELKHKDVPDTDVVKMEGENG